MRGAVLLRVVIAAAFVPFGLAAQVRPGGLGSSGERGKLGQLARDPGITIPKVVNPVNLLIEHRIEVALNDTQFARVIAIKRVLDSTNAPLARKLDSIQRLFKPRPIFSTTTRERRDSIAEARSVVLDLVAGLRENIASGRDSAYAVLSAQQLATAQGLEIAAERASNGEGQGGRGQQPVGPLTQPRKPPD